MHKKIYDILVTLNIPVAYDHFVSNKEVSIPFIVYREVNTNTFKADGITYYRPYEFEIELITEKKDVYVYFRVSDVFNNMTIFVRDGEKIVFSKTKTKLSPGEMEKIMIKSSMLENANELCFSLEENWLWKKN